MVDRVTDSGGPDTYIDFQNLNVIGREGFLNGTIIILESLDDKECGLELQISNSPTGDGNYKNLPFGYKKSDCCSIFKKIYPKYIQPSLEGSDKSNMHYVDPEKGLCPYPAGEYWFNKILLDTRNWPAQMPRGMTKITLFMYKNDVKTTTTDLIVQVEDA